MKQIASTTNTYIHQNIFSATISEDMPRFKLILSLLLIKILNAELIPDQKYEFLIDFTVK